MTTYKDIPDLTAISDPGTIDDAAVMEISIGGTSYKVTVAQGKALFGGLVNPMTTAGDMIIGGTSGAPARFAAPTTGTTWSLTYVIGTGYVWSSSAASVAWGGITGTLSSQTDLQAALTAASAYDWIVALGDETTAITTGAAKVTVRAPRAMTLTKIKASLTTASSSGNPTFDVKKNGTSVFSTTLSIDATEKTSETATTAAVLSTTSIAADDELTFDITTAGTGAAGAKIILVATA